MKCKCCVICAASIGILMFSKEESNFWHFSTKISIFRAKLYPPTLSSQRNSNCPTLCSRNLQKVEGKPKQNKWRNLKFPMKEVNQRLKPVAAIQIKMLHQWPVIPCPIIHSSEWLLTDSAPTLSTCSILLENLSWNPIGRKPSSKNQPSKDAKWSKNANKES